MSGVTGIVSATPAFVPGSFDAQDVRLATLGNLRPGLYETGDFAVSQRAAGANMSLDIGAGRCFISPGDASQQGVYLARLATADAPYNTLADGGYTWTAADATNPRIDLVCIEVEDQDFSGSYTGYKFRIVDGTPNAGATSQNVTTYWPAIPSGAIAVAAVRVPATATTLTTANITNLNPVGGHARIPDSQVSGGYDQLTSSSAGNGDKLDMTVVGDGVTPMRIQIAAQTASNGAIAVRHQINLRDGASGTGTVFGNTSIGIPAGFAATALSFAPIDVIVAPFSGSKTFYVSYGTAGADTPTFTASATNRATMRATWAPDYLNS